MRKTPWIYLDGCVICQAPRGQRHQTSCLPDYRPGTVVSRGDTASVDGDEFERSQRDLSRQREVEEDGRAGEWSYVAGHSVFTSSEAH